MTLTELLNSFEFTDGGLSATVPDDWMQRRSVFGGLQAIVAAQAMQRLSDGLPIRTLQGTLIEPMSGNLQCRTELVRSSKNSRHIEARLFNESGQLCATFFGIFARSRESVVRWTRPRQAKANKALVWPYLEGQSPEFMRHFEVCQTFGHPPGAEKPDTEHLFKLTLKDKVSTSTLAHVLALSDFPPPVGHSWSNQRKPGSTATWMLNFTGAPVDGHALEDWDCEVVLDAARDGYVNQTVSLYAPGGELILRGTQCMVVFV